MSEGRGSAEHRFIWRAQQFSSSRLLVNTSGQQAVPTCQVDVRNEGALATRGTICEDFRYGGLYVRLSNESDRYGFPGHQCLVHLPFRSEPVLELPTWDESASLGAEVGGFAH